MEVIDYAERSGGEEIEALMEMRPLSLLDLGVQRFPFVFTVGKGINISSQIEL